MQLEQHLTERYKKKTNKKNDGGQKVWSHPSGMRNWFPGHRQEKGGEIERDRRLQISDMDFGLPDIFCFSVFQKFHRRYVEISRTLCPIIYIHGILWNCVRPVSAHPLQECTRISHDQCMNVCVCVNGWMQCCRVLWVVSWLEKRYKNARPFTRCCALVNFLYLIIWWKWKRML